MRPVGNRLMLSPSRNSGARPGPCRSERGRVEPPAADTQPARGSLQRSGPMFGPDFPLPPFSYPFASCKQVVRTPPVVRSGFERLSQGEECIYFKMLWSKQLPSVPDP